MYLDHVTDSMLKGIGEHVFSMWVNIADALLSVVLVFLLIPVLDISGYAIVIIIMELFNFSLSYMRLRKRVSFKVYPLLSIGMPLLAAAVSVYAAKNVFSFSGSASPILWLISKIIFALCIYLSLTVLSWIVINQRKSKLKVAK